MRSLDEPSLGSGLQPRSDVDSTFLEGADLVAELACVLEPGLCEGSGSKTRSLH